MILSPSLVHFKCDQKLLIALARYGGLRIPSEALSLTWDDVDLKKNQFTVRSSKTAHHPDGGVRVVPMFPELRPYFQAVYDQAKPGEMEVITRYRHSTVNLRTQFQRYIAAAGLNPWPKLWQNLRASRATDLANRFPSHVASAWLGHTEKIADEFYPPPKTGPSWHLLPNFPPFLTTSLSLFPLRCCHHDRLKTLPGTFRGDAKSDAANARKGRGRGESYRNRKRAMSRKPLVFR